MKIVRAERDTACRFPRLAGVPSPASRLTKSGASVKMTTQFSRCPCY